MPMRVRLLGNGVDGITVNSESWDQLRTRWRHLDFSISLAIPIDAWGADNAFSPLVESSRGLKWLHYQVAKLASAYGGTVPVEPTGSMLHMDDEGVQECKSRSCAAVFKVVVIVDLHKWFPTFGNDTLTGCHFV